MTATKIGIIVVCAYVIAVAPVTATHIVTALGTALVAVLHGLVTMLTALTA